MGEEPGEKLLGPTRLKPNMSSYLSRLLTDHTSIQVLEDSHTALLLSESVFRTSR